MRTAGSWTRLTLAAGTSSCAGRRAIGMTAVRETRAAAGDEAQTAAAAARPAVRPENRHPPRNVPSSAR